MKKFKRLAILALCIVTMAVSSVAFTGCSKKYDLRVLFLGNAEETKFYQSLFDEIGSELGLKIGFFSYVHGAYYQQLKLDMQDNPPDLFYVRPNDIKKLVGEGQLATFNNYFNSEEFKEAVDVSKIYKNAIDAYRYDGQNVGVESESAPIYGVNLGFSYQGLGYNKKLVSARQTEIKKAGLKLPWELEEGKSYTFEQFEQLLKICTTAKGGGLTGSDPVYGMEATKNILPFVWSRGHDVIDFSTGTVTINNPATEYALEYVKRGIAEGYMLKGGSYGDWSANSLAFYGSVGSWEIPSYEAQDMEIDMIPWPSENGDNNWYGQVTGSAFAVSSKSKKLDLAISIASRFYREEYCDRLLKSGFVLPIYQETAEVGYLDKSNDEIYRPENRKVFIDVVSGKNGKVHPTYNTWSTEWFDDFTDDLDVVFSNNVSIKSFLSSKQSSMQTLYNMEN